MSNSQADAVYLLNGLPSLEQEAGLVTYRKFSNGRILGTITMHCFCFIQNMIS